MQLSLTLSFSIKISQEKNHSVYTIVLIQTIKENRKNNLLYFFCHDQLRNKIKQTKLKFLPAVNLLRFNILIHTTLAVKKRQNANFLDLTLQCNSFRVTITLWSLRTPPQTTYLHYCFEKSWKKKHYGWVFLSRTIKTKKEK